MAFEPITSQEALDALLQTERQNTEQRFNGWLSPEAVQKQYQGWTSPEDLQTLKDQHQAALTERDTKIQGFERQILRGRVAREEGLPPELAERLTGEDEAALRADAKNLLKIVKPANPGGYPPANPEKKPDKKQAANDAFRAAFGH